MLFDEALNAVSDERAVKYFKDLHEQYNDLQRVVRNVRDFVVTDPDNYKELIEVFDETVYTTRI